VTPARTTWISSVRIRAARMGKAPARRAWLRPASLAAAAALTLAGCGSQGPTVVPPPGVQDTSSCGTVRLAVNPWVGYEANSAVVSYLLRNELGCTVEAKREPELESWKHLASGEVDVILENWGHDDLKKKYIDQDKVAVELGLTGNKGVIGWYVPPWMVEEYPDITDWRNLNKYADLFETPRSGGKGQLLDADPSYVTNDPALVRNLGLNFTVIRAGSEELLIDAFRKAERDKTPLLGYFYSPQWLLSETKLVHIALPQYTPGCDANPETVKCDYQPYDLDKIASREFAYSGSPAAELIKNFTWTNDDQNQVARDIADRGLSPDEAAKRWLDSHRGIWRKWLPNQGA
jgi:glycine betaine/proline transport system substrate-binding protein